MPTVTSSRRRIAMAVLLALAAGGTLVRHYAPAPSTLRDIGTLFMVMWLPAVGNLIGYLAAKLPRSTPPPTGFAEGSVFTPHMTVAVTPLPLPAADVDALLPGNSMCTLIVGRRGFTARAAQPIRDMLAGAEERTAALELLRPDSAKGYLRRGTEFHLLIGTTAVARGRVVGIDAGDDVA